MENAHVARVSNDNADKSNSANNKKSPSSDSSGKDDRKVVKENDDGKELESSSNNGGKQADNKDDGGASIVKDETADEKDKKKKKEDKKEANKKNPIKQLNKANAMGSAVGTGYKLIAMAQFFMMMKMMFQGAVAAVSNFFTGILGWLFGVVQAVGGFFGSIGGAIGSAFSAVAGLFSAAASALGVSATAMALAVVTAATGGATVVVGSAAVSANNAVTAQRDENVEEDCAGTGLSKATAAGITVDVDANAQMLQYAQQTYSVYKHYGFSDIHIAAVLANWQGESSMDPTSIESVFGEQYNINGPKHQAAIASNFDMNVYNPSASMEVYHGDPPKPSGIGFAGYTAENATALIEYAKSFNKNWWDFDVQVAFSMDATKGYASANWLQTTFKNTNYTDLATAVRAYVEEFERPKWPEAAVTERVPYAEAWKARIMQGTDGFNTNDTTIKDSVISMVGAAATTGANNTASSAKSQCNKLGGNCYDNSDLVAAAVSLTRPPGDDAWHTDGTEVYQKVVNEVIGDGLYQSCDHYVCAAVRWSGSDDNYPPGNVGTQTEYVEGNPDKWEIVKSADSDANGFFNSGSFSDSHLPQGIMPGDVVMEYTGSSRQHTWIYVGEEAITAVYPENGTNANYHFSSISASYMDYAPMCKPFSPGHAQFRLFRLKTPDANSQYKNKGATFTSSSAGAANCVGSASVEELLSKASLTKNELSSRGIKQLVTVESNSSTATISFFEYSGSDWKQDMSLTTPGFVGSNGVTSNPSEGLAATPKGLWGIGQAFYQGTKPNTKLDSFKIDSNTYWVDDPNSSYYNTRVTTTSGWSSAEHMSAIPGYKYGFVINYNMNPVVKGKGSAIFFHVANGGPTGGCVACVEDKVVAYLNKLDKAKNPYILIV